MQKRYLKTVNKSRKNKMASFSCHGFLMLSFTLILNFVKRIKKRVFYILVLGRNIYLFYLECILILNGRKAPLRGHSTYAIENERPQYGDMKRIQFSFHLFIIAVVFFNKYCNLVHPWFVDHALTRNIYRNITF